MLEKLLIILKNLYCTENTLSGTWFCELLSDWSKTLFGSRDLVSGQKVNKKRYDSELPYQRPDLIEVMEIEIDFTTSINVHTGFYINVRECLD